MINIIIPVRNEEENIIETITALENTDLPAHRIIIIDDYSTDKTKEIVERIAKERENLELITNNYSPGFGNALRTGFEQVKEGVIVPFMADLCDRPEDISRMYKKIEEGYEVICASRYTSGGRIVGRTKRLKVFLSKWAGLTLQKLARLPTSDAINAFKMYRKKVIESIDIKSVGFAASLELFLKAYYKGYKIYEIPTVWRERSKGARTGLRTLLSDT